MTYNGKETACKEILEGLFPGYIFNKVRLPSFKNPETGRSLELDLYNSDLKIALEYNGPQHYMQFAKYHRKEGDFEKQVVRDIFKEEYCRINNIVLIEVPNLFKYSDIEEYIIKFLDVNNIHCKEKTIDSKEMQGKISSSCCEEKNLGDFPIDKSKKDGRKSMCKICRNNRNKLLRSVKKAEKHNAGAQSIPEDGKTKECYKCGENKLVEDFPIDKSKKDGRRNECKICRSEYVKNLNSHKKDLVEDNSKIVQNKEIEEMQEELNNILRNSYYDEEVVKVFCKKIGEIHNKIHFPPTNIFKIYELKIMKSSDFTSNIETIKYRLSLFLAMKRKKIAVDIEIVKGRKYQLNSELIVTLPQDILLSNEEVNEFRDSLSANSQVL